ncbi:hypothetical protein MYAM1_002385 [Malassezia yamatoensis]|uniref:Uncharacterized protein n=1 Tax=Malassezia yamatoensis TaxID=253288 RepID=A0AAJ6CHV5_9BASI|nr:hypothetical protein MYAM1_002385 [Malassezia yamatoensis]
MSLQLVRRLSSTTGSLSKTRVSTLPFQLGSQDAIHRARLGALEQLLPTIKGWMTESEEDVMRFESIQSMYLPVWAIDALWKVNCKGEAGQATVTFVSTESTLPGNAYKPLSTLPLRPPPLLDTAEQQSATPDSPVKGAESPMQYMPYDPERHLQPDVDIHGKISVLPFNLSPSSLPTAFQEASLRTLMMNMLSQGPPLHIQRRFKLLPGVEIQLANINQSQDPDAQAMIRLERDSLHVDMMACYPVLLPIHLVRFRYDAHGETDRLATVAVGAWDSQLLVYAMYCDEQPTWVTKGSSNWLNLEMLDFDPQIPVPSSALNSSSGSDASNRSEARIVDLMTQQSQMQSLFENRAEELIDHADWQSCLDWEKLHKSADQPESKLGLGEINWDNNQIRPMYEGVAENRQYIALVGESLFSQRLLDSVERDQREGRDVSNVHTIQNDKLVTGEQAIDALRERQREVCAMRDAKLPRWLNQKEN